MLVAESMSLPKSAPTAISPVAPKNPFELTPPTVFWGILPVGLVLGTSPLTFPWLSK